jgi:2-polyprenyl-6-methoxyphenol hydroxylase-like FAD-dependent oxidoreductase
VDGAESKHRSVPRLGRPDVHWIGISRSSHAAQESWLAEGRVEDALAEYADWHPTIRTIIGATPRVLCQALYDREPLVEWRVGRVVLLGDAAHPMMPFSAQGAGQSIEDAYVLAGCLALRPDEPVTALERYVRLRQPRTAWMQQLAGREEELYHMANPAEIAHRNAGYGRSEVQVRPSSRRNRSGFTATMRKRSCTGSVEPIARSSVPPDAGSVDSGAASPWCLVAR